MNESEIDRKMKEMKKIAERVSKEQVNVAYYKGHLHGYIEGIRETAERIKKYLDENPDWMLHILGEVLEDLDGEERKQNE